MNKDGNTYLNATSEGIEQLEMRLKLLHRHFGIDVDRIEYKGNPLSIEIHNAIHTKIDKEPKLEKFNSDGDPISHLKGCEYIMELRCGLNDKLKVKYFPLSLIGDAGKWLHSLALVSITSFSN